jgi:hypothetical protein
MKGTMMRTETYVRAYPDCDICKYEQGRTTEAHYDGRTTGGQWANMCDVHFASRGLGLGEGRGQRLIVGEKPEMTEAERRKQIHQAVADGDLDLAEELIGDGDIAEWL